MVRVLLADDHAAFRDLVRGILDDTADIRVVAEASDGDAAVAALRQYRPDVAILDLDMPGQDGLRVASMADKLEPSIKTILLTVHKSPALLNKALIAGLCGYVLKDEAVDQIADCVRRVHAGGRYFSRQLRGGNPS